MNLRTLDIVTQASSDVSRDIYRRAPSAKPGASEHLIRAGGVNYLIEEQFKFSDDLYLCANSRKKRLLVDMVRPDPRFINVARAIETELSTLRDSGDSYQPQLVTKHEGDEPTYTVFFPLVQDSLAQLHIESGCKPQSIATIQGVLLQLARQLEGWHAHGCVHGNIRLGNILFDKNRLFVAKLGADYRGSTTYVLSPSLPPEAVGVLTDAPVTASPAWDSWGLGVVCLELLGFKPFAPRLFGLHNARDVRQSHISSAYVAFEKLRLDADAEINPEWKSSWGLMWAAVDSLPADTSRIVRTLLAYDPGQRCTMRFVAETLEPVAAGPRSPLLWSVPRRNPLQEVELRELDQRLTVLNGFWRVSWNTPEAQAVGVSLASFAPTTFVTALIMHTPLFGVPTAAFTAAPVLGLVVAALAGFWWWHRQSSRQPGTDLALPSSPNMGFFDRMMYRLSERLFGPLPAASAMRGFEFCITMMKAENLVDELKNPAHETLARLASVDQWLFTSLHHFNPLAQKMLKQQAFDYEELRVMQQFLRKVSGDRTPAQAIRGIKQAIHSAHVDKVLPLAGKGSYAMSRAEDLTRLLTTVIELFEYEPLTTAIAALDEAGEQRSAPAATLLIQPLLMP